MKIFYKTQEKIKDKMSLDKEVIHMKKETRTVVYDDELRMRQYFLTFSNACKNGKN